MSLFPRLRFRRSATPGTTYTRPRLAVSDSDGTYGIKGLLSDNSDGDEVILKLENTRFLIVEESDGLPVAVDVRRMRVPNGTLTDLGGGFINFAPSGGGGGTTTHDIDGALHDGYPGGTTTFLRADGTFATPSGGGVGADNNEDKASVLADATSTGDAGGRADHFPGTSLSGSWTQEATAPTATVVKYSSFAITAAAGGATHYMKTYTPSGAFRVEARCLQAVSDGDMGILVRDSSAGDSTGDGMLALVSGGSAFAYSLDTGAYTQRGSTIAGATVGVWTYLAIERDGSNNWTLSVSWDRALWVPMVSAHSKTFTVAKMGPRVFTSRRGLIDFIDVVS